MVSGDQYIENIYKNVFISTILRDTGKFTTSRNLSGCTDQPCKLLQARKGNLGSIFNQINIAGCHEHLDTLAILLGLQSDHQSSQNLARAAGASTSHQINAARCPEHAITLLGTVWVEHTCPRFWVCAGANMGLRKGAVVWNDSHTSCKAGTNATVAMLGDQRVESVGWHQHTHKPWQCSWILEG